MDIIKISKIYHYENELSKYFKIYNNKNDKPIFDNTLKIIDTIVIFNSYEDKDLYEKEFLDDEFNKTIVIDNQLKNIDGFGFKVDKQSIFGSNFILFFKFSEYEMMENFVKKFESNISKLYTNLEKTICCK